MSPSLCAVLMKNSLVWDIVAIRLIPLEGSKVVEEGMGEKERRGTEKLKCSREGGKRKNWQRL